MEKSIERPTKSVVHRLQGAGYRYRNVRLTISEWLVCVVNITGACSNQ